MALSLRKGRTKTHKLTVDRRSGAGELYDLANDPLETCNLFDAPEADGGTTGAGHPADPQARRRRADEHAGGEHLSEGGKLGA